MRLVHGGTDQNLAGTLVRRDAAGGFAAGAVTAGGTLDMQNNLILNIGAAGTDFTAGGGLTLAGLLRLDGGGDNTLFLNNATSNWIRWPATGSASPAVTTRSAGTRLVLWPSINATDVDFALGIEPSTIWFSVPSTGYQYRFYGGTSVAATLTGAGALTLAGALTVSAGVTTLGGALLFGSGGFTSAAKAYTDATSGLIFVGGGGTGGEILFARKDTGGNLLQLKTTSADFAVPVTVSAVNLNITGVGVLQMDGVQVVSDRGAAVADAAGGATIDAEARTAINTWLARARTHGLIAP